jgi:diphthamide biosynthesis protein 2
MLDTHTLTELDACASWLFSRRSARVAVQVPSEHLPLAPQLLASLAAALRAAGALPSPLLFIVGDTAFSPCCIDEVAAAHYGADAVVHVGATCLSPTARLPAFHVLAPPGEGAWAHFNAAACGAAIAAHVREAEAADHHALLVWDTEGAGLVGRALAATGAALGADGGDGGGGGVDVAVVAWASPHPQLLVPFARRCFEGGAGGGTPEHEHEREHGVCGLRLPLEGLPAELRAALRGRGNPVLRPLRVLHLGVRPARARALLAACGACAGGVWRVDPSGGAPCARLDGGPHARLLASRYRLVGLLKGAGAVGLVAGTLALEGRGALLDALRAALTRAGKSVHTLLVGKVTPAKLANFHGACDVFVLVACPEASLLDGEDAAAHAVPVATPHEAFVALEELAREAEEEGEEKEGGGAGEAGGGGAGAASPLAWDGSLHLAFHALMGRVEGSRVAAGTARAKAAAAADAAADAGRTRVAAAALVERQGGQLVAAAGGDAAARLQRREWRGLAYEAPRGDGGAAASTAILKGRSGVASRYAHEL